MERLGIYIHWPFCRSKCPYCGFFSRVAKNIDQQEIVNGYFRELEFYHRISADKQVDTVFFGGGTPSLLQPVYVERLIDKIIGLWPCADKMEISLEANPNTGHPGWLGDLAAAGINRLSLGVQSLDEKNLKFLGRTHNLQQALTAIEETRHYFSNCSIDLMYGLPEQTPADWEKELQAALRLDFPHYSLYQLTIEENTAFARKNIQSAPETTAAEMFDLCRNVLETGDIYRYEISNYARLGKECRHNLGYWHGDDYVGIGNGAAGRLRSGKKFFDTSYYCRCQELTASERAEELLIMGLRIREGINKKDFENRCGLALEQIIDKSSLNKLIREGFLTDTPNQLQVTETGMKVLDYLITKLCL